MPTALIEQAQQRGELSLLDYIEPEAVLVEFPVSHKWRSESGFTRFVQLRQGAAKTRYALIR